MTLPPNGLKPWHTVTLRFQGPQSSETAEVNPFTDYRLLVRFTHANASYTIRGFYAADGNAAESSATEGNVWQARFSPDRAGEWSYHAALRRGPNIAINEDPDAGAMIEIADAQGTFTVQASDSEAQVGADFRQRGRLIADGFYFRFGPQGKRWLKGGADSPENLLAYDGFDGTHRIAIEATEGEATASKSLHRYARTSKIGKTVTHPGNQAKERA